MSTSSTNKKVAGSNSIQKNIAWPCSLSRRKKPISCLDQVWAVHGWMAGLLVRRTVVSNDCKWHRMEDNGRWWRCVCECRARKRDIDVDTIMALSWLVSGVSCQQRTGKQKADGSWHHNAAETLRDPAPCCSSAWLWLCPEHCWALRWRSALLSRRMYATCCLHQWGTTDMVTINDNTWQCTIRLY